MALWILAMDSPLNCSGAVFCKLATNARRRETRLRLRVINLSSSVICCSFVGLVSL